MRRSRRPQYSGFHSRTLRIEGAPTKCKPPQPTDGRPLLAAQPEEGLRTDLSSCDDCDQPLTWKVIQGKNVPHNPDGHEHRLTCTGERWTRWRVRRGLVPGVYPMSISRIGAYRRCPKNYYRRYVQHLPDADSSAAEFGRQFHAYAAARMIAIRDGQAPPPRPPSPTVESVYEWTAMCTALEAQVWDGSNVYGIEQPIEYVWHDEQMVVAFEGILDLVTVDTAGGSATIHDLKTGWAVESPVELFQQLQSQVYALLLLRKVPGLKRIRFKQLQFRRGGRAVAARHPLEGRDYYVAEDLDEVERSLRQEVGTILRDGDFTANPACATCPVGAHEMPALEYYKTITVGVANGYLEIPALRTPRTGDEAGRLALLAHVSRRIEAAARAAVRGWCADHGPLSISPDEALGHWERNERACRDIPAALDLLVRNGHDLDRYVRLNTHELKSLIDPRSRRYLPELGALIDVKVATSYGFRKYRPDDRTPSRDRATPEISSTVGPTLTVIEGGLQPVSPSP